MSTTLRSPTFRNDDIGAELSRNFSACIEDYTECISSNSGHEICKKAFDKCSIGILLESEIDTIQGRTQ